MLTRRVWLYTTGSAALTAMLATRRSIAELTTLPAKPFIVLLRGVYQPVKDGPNLGLAGINLSDGSYAQTLIYPVFEVPESNNKKRSDNVGNKPIGKFYTQANAPAPGSLCAYELPDGALAMEFQGGQLTPHPDGTGGRYLAGTLELPIKDATGIYKIFNGGHNHMVVNRFHELADGKMDENCFCNISPYQFP